MNTIAQLQSADLKWVSKDTSPIYLEVLKIQLSLTELKDFQKISCGAKFGTLSESIKFLLDRDEYLREEEREDGYHSYPCCSSGYYSRDDLFTMWYESTSGMLVYHKVDTVTGENTYEVSIPTDRRFGSRHEKLEFIAAGATAEQWKRWDTSYLQEGEERQKIRDERNAFYSKNLEPLGWPSLQEMEQEDEQRKAEAIARAAERVARREADAFEDPYEEYVEDYEEYVD